MRTFFDPAQLAHAPREELHNGGFTAYAETPVRAEQILSAIGGAELPKDRGEAPILAVHTPDYVAFLKDAPGAWAAAGRAGDAIPYAFRRAQTTALDAIAGFEPGLLVLSFGADTWENDPISHFKLTTADFAVLACDIADRGWPTAIVMEGGYAVGALGANVASLIGGFSG